MWCDIWAKRSADYSIALQYNLGSFQIGFEIVNRPTFRISFYVPFLHFYYVNKHTETREFTDVLPDDAPDEVIEYLEELFSEDGDED